MTSAEYLAEFLVKIGCRYVFALTGGACAYMLDAIERQKDLRLIFFQNEQAAAMAADAIWRVSKQLGVTVATSGPGATNLITGIACSYFDSIPSFHITGQVSLKESSAIHGAKVRQSGFQETNIVEMVKPIVKYAQAVNNVNDLNTILTTAYIEAISGRMGPVLVDIPIDIQQAEINAEPKVDIIQLPAETSKIHYFARVVSECLFQAERPLVLWGGGVQLAGAERALSAWLREAEIPFVSSWAGITAFNHNHNQYAGQIGVYGNRGANFIIQNCDVLIVFGSRLDNRQRSGNTDSFCSSANVYVFDIDEEELRKYESSYNKFVVDLKILPDILRQIKLSPPKAEWLDYVAEMKSKYFRLEDSSVATERGSISPYQFIKKLSKIIDSDAIVIGDTGASVCWLFQSFEVINHKIFTAGGHSPMGYSLCAAIGAKLAQPAKQVIAYTGDGGFQLNIQELQTINYLELDIKIIVMNNGCYGIIKQFQNSYLEGRHTGSEVGYSVPDFGKIAYAYGLRYVKIQNLNEFNELLFKKGPIIIEVDIDPDTLIEPKQEMGRPINDQYPYLSNREYTEGNRYVSYPRPNK